MSRYDADLLDDIAAAIASIHSHLQHGPISVEIVMDTVAMRLLEIGEAVKALSPEITATEPDIKWRDIAGMRDFWPTTTSPPTPKSSKLSSTRTWIRSARPSSA